MLSIDDIRKKIFPLCREYEIKSAYLFGSYARGDSTDESDIDIRIEKGDGNKLQSLLQVSGFRCRLEDSLQKKVDLITILPQQSLYDIFRKKILKEEILLYEAEG